MMMGQWIQDTKTKEEMLYLGAWEWVAACMWEEIEKN